MGTNGTHSSHARCHPRPIPQPAKVGRTTGVYVPYSFRKVVWVVLHPTRARDMNRSAKVLWDGTQGFSSLSEKTRKSRKYNHLQMSLQRQHDLLSYLKTLSVGRSGRGLNPRPPTQQTGAFWANQADGDRSKYLTFSASLYLAPRGAYLFQAQLRGEVNRDGGLIWEGGLI